MSIYPISPTSKSLITGDEKKDIENNKKTLITKKSLSTFTPLLSSNPLPSLSSISANLSPKSQVASSQSTITANLSPKSQIASSQSTITRKIRTNNNDKKNFAITSPLFSSSSSSASSSELIQPPSSKTIQPQQKGPSTEPMLTPTNSSEDIQDNLTKNCQDAISKLKSNFQSSINYFEYFLTSLQEKISALEKEILEKNKIISDLNKEMKKLKLELSQKEKKLKTSEDTVQDLITQTNAFSFAQWEFSPHLPPSPHLDPDSSRVFLKSQPSHSYQILPGRSYPAVSFSPFSNPEEKEIASPRNLHLNPLPSLRLPSPELPCPRKPSSRF